MISDEALMLEFQGGSRDAFEQILPTPATRNGGSPICCAIALASCPLFLLENGPTLVLWGLILFFPARLVWKKVRRSFAQ
jgi:hypothetical protein